MQIRTAPEFMDKTVIARTQDDSTTAHAGFQHAGQPAGEGTTQGKRMANRVIETSTAGVTGQSAGLRRSGMCPA
jgi:hypothetical protein